MGAVLGGMTLLQIVRLIAALDAAGLSLLKIRDELQKDGTKGSDPVALEVEQRVIAAIRRVTDSTSQPGAFMESRSNGAPLS